MITVTTTLPVSVLMTTYLEEPASHVAMALDSLFAQTSPAAEIVLVLDGAISDALRQTLQQYPPQGHPTRLITVGLSDNMGQGQASNAGLRHCTQPWIARMDSDDWCAPQRLEQQWDAISKNPTLDVVFSWQGEFDENPHTLTAIKKAPATHEDIRRALRWRNVISHPTLLIRKSFLEKVGGYQPLRIMEDYDLCMRLLAAGAIFNGIQAPLVMVRVLPEQRQRRSGLGYALTEWKVRYRFYKDKHFSFIFYIFSSIIYTVFRLQPAWIKPLLYRLVRNKPSERPLF
jgi:glycosyltransferase involved in cell wall biosynthesis